MGAHELHETAKAIVADDKGDPRRRRVHGHDQEALRLDRRRVDRGEPARYRELLFTTPGMEDYIGGVILYDETIRQAADDGTPFPRCSPRRASIPGIKVDTGRNDLARASRARRSPRASTGCASRLAEYRELGARFAKWRAVITIGDGIPDRRCIRANAHALARYAALCQEAGIVPIVEPEVLMDADNTIERCYDVTVADARIDVPRAARARRRSRAGRSCKPNMVISGKGCPSRRRPTRIAELTRAVLHDATCPRPCPASSSSPAASRRSRRPRTSTRSTRSAVRGRSRSRTGGRCRRRRSRRGVATPPTSEAAQAAFTAPGADERARGRRRMERRAGAAGRRVGRGSPASCRLRPLSSRIRSRITSSRR